MTGKINKLYKKLIECEDSSLNIKMKYGRIYVLYSESRPDNFDVENRIIKNCFIKNTEFSDELKFTTENISYKDIKFNLPKIGFKIKDPEKIMKESKLTIIHQKDDFNLSSLFIKSEKKI